MARRFTDKNKWEDEWYLSLDNDCRMVWEYLLDRCDHAGVFKKNMRMINFCCCVMWDAVKLEQVFDGRIIDRETFYFIPKYLKFQYPKGLNSKKPAIVSVRNILKEKSLYDYVNKLYGNDYLMINQSLLNSKPTVKDKDKDKDKDKNRDKDKDKSKVKDKDIVVFPESLNSPDFKKAWSEWEQHRKEIKKKLTPTTIKRQLKTLSQFKIEIAISSIEKSIQQGWTGLFPEKEQENGQHKNQQHKRSDQGSQESGSTGDSSNRPGGSSFIR